ncbi:MAG: hypothetical protein HYU78_18270 [Rhodocyclales bacterium]|nr:hypothetical protein [Rhodocyclales bacterium]
MAVQAVAKRRCASCERWSGPRAPAEDGGHVRIESETSTGLCVGGPWDGSERRARSACGQWRRWQILPEEPGGG